MAQRTSYIEANRERRLPKGAAAGSLNKIRGRVEPTAGQFDESSSAHRAERSDVRRGLPDGRLRFEHLSRALKSHAGESHLILCLGTPDPDAISSALALQYLGEQYDIDSTVMAFTGVSHHENRALVKRLEINLVKYNQDFDLSPFKSYSIVDSQKVTTPIDTRLKEHGVPMLAFIDHHREDLNPPPAQFVDVRPQYGSTAAIFCEYLQEALPSGLSPSDPNHVRLATALMHGLRSDTNRFLTATQYDYEASAFIGPCVDMQVIEVIERKVLTPSMLDMFENALVNRKIHDNFIFSDVGYVRSSDRDAIPQVAELLLSREGTDTVLVFGVVDEKTIDGSLRTRSETINPDEFLKAVLGVSPESGRYYGGGNIRDRGGFQIPLGFFSMHEDKNQIYTMARQVIEKAFLDYIGKAASKTRKGGDGAR